MKKARLEEWVKVPNDVDGREWFDEQMNRLRVKLFSSINLTKALYGDHAVKVLTRPVFELRQHENGNLYLICMMQIETIEEVPA